MALPKLTPRNRVPKSLSIVAPCYNEQEVARELVSRIDNAAQSTNIPYEIVLVDDGSKDDTWIILQELSKEYENLKVIKLSRNFGHQLALTCGLDQSKGEVILIIDADLQDPPELLPDMIKLWSDGFDVIYGKRQSRAGESVSKRFFAYSFYRILSKVAGVSIPQDTGDFRLMDRKALDALLSLKERHRFIRGMVSWVGFNQTPLIYKRAERFAGETKYPFKKSLLLAFNAIVSFSYAPLRIASYVGFATSIFAMLYIAVIILLKILGINVPGYTSMMATILLLGGIQLVVLGIIGEYIGRIFEQGQNRPLYIVSDISGEPKI
jgi:glycosyltransferase involved in cell wall biosynthesis